MSSTVMGPAQKAQRVYNIASARDPLSPPPFNGTGNPMQWARRVKKWERIHDTLCDKKQNKGVPKFLRGYLLAEALSGTAYQTVESTLSEDVLSSDDGVQQIIRLLVQFNPTTHAHEIFTSFKALMQIRRRQNESFKLYVNRFEAATSQLRGLTAQAADGAAEQFLASQLLEGAQVPTAVFMQVLANCTTNVVAQQDDKPNIHKTEAAKKLMEIVKELEQDEGLDIAAALPQVDDEKTAAATQAHLTALAKLRQHLEGIINELHEPKEEKKQAATPFDAIEGYGEVTVSLESAKKALRGLDAVSIEAGHQQRNMQQTYLISKGSTQPRASQPRANKPSSRKPRGMSYNRWIAIRKAKTKCMACGQKGHWAGDVVCQKSTTTQGGAMTSFTQQQQAQAPVANPANNAPDTFFE